MSWEKEQREEGSPRVKASQFDAHAQEVKAQAQASRAEAEAHRSPPESQPTAGTPGGKEQVSACFVFPKHEPLGSDAGPSGSGTPASPQGGSEGPRTEAHPFHTSPATSLPESFPRNQKHTSSAGDGELGNEASGGGSGSRGGGPGGSMRRRRGATRWGSPVAGVPAAEPEPGAPVPINVGNNTVTATVPGTSSRAVPAKGGKEQLHGSAFRGREGEGEPGRCTPSGGYTSGGPAMWGWGSGEEDEVLRSADYEHVESLELERVRAQEACARWVEAALVHHRAADGGIGGLTLMAKISLLH